MVEIKGTRRLRKQYRKEPVLNCLDTVRTDQFLNAAGMNKFLHALVHCYIRERMGVGYAQKCIGPHTRESRAKVLSDFADYVRLKALDEIDGQRDKRGRDS